MSWDGNGANKSSILVTMFLQFRHILVKLLLGKLAKDLKSDKPKTRFQDIVVWIAEPGRSLIDSVVYIFIDAFMSLKANDGLNKVGAN